MTEIDAIVDLARALDPRNATPRFKLWSDDRGMWHVVVEMGVQKGMYYMDTKKEGHPTVEAALK